MVKNLPCYARGNGAHKMNVQIMLHSILMSYIVHLEHLLMLLSPYLEKKATGDLKTFVNVSLAETYEEQGEQADPQSLLARVEQFDKLPQNAVFITAGIDVQMDRIELQAVAWGVDKESWVVDYKTFHGDTSQKQAWEDLSQYLDCKKFTHELGKKLPI